MAPVSGPRWTGRARREGRREADARRGGGPHDVHDLPIVLHLALVADAGGHLDDRRRAGGGQGRDRPLGERGRCGGGERREGEGDDAPHRGEPITRPGGAEATRARAVGRSARLAEWSSRWSCSGSQPS